MMYVDIHYTTDDGLEWEEHDAFPPRIGERVDVECEDGSEQASYRVIDVARLANREEIEGKGVADSGVLWVTLKREAVGDE